MNALFHSNLNVRGKSNSNQLKCKEIHIQLQFETRNAKLKTYFECWFNKALFKILKALKLPFLWRDGWREGGMNRWREGGKEG